MSKFDLKQSTIQNSQIGDYNSMVNNLSNDIGSLDEVKRLLLELRYGIDDAQEISKDQRCDAIATLQTVVEEVSKPTNAKNRAGLQHYWNHLVSTVNDVGTLASAAKALGDLLGLSS